MTSLLLPRSMAQWAPIAFIEMILTEEIRRRAVSMSAESYHSPPIERRDKMIEFARSVYAAALRDAAEDMRQFYGPFVAGHLLIEAHKVENSAI